MEQSEYNTISGDVYVSGIIDPDDPPVVYISFFSWLNCDPMEEYIEVTSLSMSPNPDNNMFSFSVDLPLGVYDVVASSQGFVPDTVQDIEVGTGDPITVSLEL